MELFACNFFKWLHVVVLNVPKCFNSSPPSPPDGWCVMYRPQMLNKCLNGEFKLQTKINQTTNNENKLFLFETFYLFTNCKQTLQTKKFQIGRRVFGRRVVSVRCIVPKCI